MKKCPLCNIGLIAVDYEGVRVMYCGDCGGYLVPKERLESIKRVARKSPETLKEEASAEFTESTAHAIKCPRCFAFMKKKDVSLPILDIQTDFCHHCDLLWLDPGELALLQLAHQASAKFINAQEMKERMATLEASPERKERFEKDLAKLPKHKDGLELGLDEIGESVLGSIIMGNTRYNIFKHFKG